MSGRRLRNLLVLAMLAGIGYWYYRTQPTFSEFIDGITGPLFGSRAAVKESERKRVISDAASAIGRQTGENVGILRENMSPAEVRELLGDPDRTETLSEREPHRVRWTYNTVRRIVLFEDGKVVSITVR
jgi:hypothetical protein